MCYTRRVAKTDFDQECYQGISQVRLHKNIKLVFNAILVWVFSSVAVQWENGWTMAWSSISSCDFLKM